MKEIERAIELIKLHLKITEELLEDNNPKTTNSNILKDIEDDKKDVVSYNLAIQVLQSELDRQENKALTLSELKDMVGEPVWVKSDKSITCKRLSYVSSIAQLYNVFFDDSCGLDNKYSYIFNDYNFYKHKPNGGE